MYRINLLPNELENIIQEFIPIRFLYNLNKKYYFKYHKHIKQWIPREIYENYLRDMVRNDNHFVFDFLIKENSKIWQNIKKYKYKNTFYSDYFRFLDAFCIENESTKCRNLLQVFLHKSGLSKNQHKKNTTTNIRWTN